MSLAFVFYKNKYFKISILTKENTRPLAEKVLEEKAENALRQLKEVNDSDVDVVGNDDNKEIEIGSGTDNQQVKSFEDKKKDRTKENCRVLLLMKI